MMLKTLFYIPANKRKYFKAFDKYSPSFFIVDLEDSIKSDEIENSIEYLINLKHSSTVPIYIRIPSLGEEFIQKHPKLFSSYKNFVLPKVEDSMNLANFIEHIGMSYSIENYQFIVLIETPLGVINIRDILSTGGEKIIGLGFGSYDYCNQIGAYYSYENFQHAQNEVFLYGKAFNKMCIDIASLNIQNEDLFKEECLNSFRMGYDAKPVLHPMQLECIQKMDYYSEEEYEMGRKAYLFFGDFIPEELQVVKFEGIILEKPLVKRLNQIIEIIKERS